jgi:hypothetical protein
VKKHIGILKFGKSRPAPKMIEVDVTYDEKTAEMLFQTGIKALKKDKDAVIAYVIEKALKEFAKSKS